MNSLENIENDPSALHDVHGPWEYQGTTRQYELYNRSTSLFHSEFGVEGVTNLKSLNATIAPEHQWPATLDNPIWQHLGAWWNQYPMWQKVFGDMPDIETLVRATQFLQAEGLRYAVEADQRRKFQNSGTLPWQFNEPYPMATCTSAVDYYGQAKPSYYAVARAYEPLHLSAKFATIAWAGRDSFETEIWLNNFDESAITDAKLSAKLIGLGGTIYNEQVKTIKIEPNCAAHLLGLKFPLDDLKEIVFFFDLRLQDQSGQLLSRNRYPFTNATNLSLLLELPLTQLDVQPTKSDNDWKITVTNIGSQAAVGIWLQDNRPISADGYIYFEDNHFSLLPNETRAIVCHWQNIPQADRSLSLSAWNAREWEC
jgi:beta-mannosidase